MPSLSASDENWLRRGWEGLPTDKEEFVAWLARTGLSLEAFMTSSRSEAMPESLRRELEKPETPA